MLGSHVAWLSTFDAAAGEFHVLATDGALARSTGTMVAGRSRGIAGVVMETRLPFSTPDYLHDTRFAHDPELDATFREEGTTLSQMERMLTFAEQNEIVGLEEMKALADKYGA